MKVKYTKLQVALEIVGSLLIIGMILFLSIQWNQIPDQIPRHYNAMGEVDRWGRKIEILISPLVGILLYTLFTALSFLPQTWNVPFKITDVNGKAIYDCTRSLLIFIKVEFIGIFFYTTYRSITAQSLSVYFIPLLLLVLLGTVLYFVIKISKMGKKKKY